MKLYRDYRLGVRVSVLLRFVLVVFVGICFFAPTQVEAGCHSEPGAEIQCGGNMSDTCDTHEYGGSSGISYYNCYQDYVNPEDHSDGLHTCCFYHHYYCDGACGQNGGGDGSGGNFQGQDCPNGTTLTCNNSTPMTCLRKGKCDDTFPSQWHPSGDKKKDQCKKGDLAFGLCEDDCTCQSACTPTAPSVTTLSSPANGASLPTTSVNLLWNTVSNWGTTCSGGANEYEIYVGACPNPTTLVETLSGTENSYTFDGAVNTTYCWKIRTNNGQEYSDSSVGSFTVLGNQPTVKLSTSTS